MFELKYYYKVHLGCHTETHSDNIVDFLIVSSHWKVWSLTGSKLRLEKLT